MPSSHFPPMRIIREVSGRVEYPVDIEGPSRKIHPIPKKRRHQHAFSIAPSRACRICSLFFLLGLTSCLGASSSSSSAQRSKRRATTSSHRIASPAVPVPLLSRRQQTACRLAIARSSLPLAPCKVRPRRSLNFLAFRYFPVDFAPRLRFLVAGARECAACCCGAPSWSVSPCSISPRMLACGVSLVLRWRGFLVRFSLAVSTRKLRH